VRRLIVAALLAIAASGCSFADEPGTVPTSTGHITRERIDSYTAILHDDDRGVTCYLWGTNGIYCLRDDASAAP